jgi:hypothetical protein
MPPETRPAQPVVPEAVPCAQLIGQAVHKGRMPVCRSPCEATSSQGANRVLGLVTRDLSPRRERRRDEARTTRPTSAVWTPLSPAKLSTRSEVVCVETSG